MDGMTLSQEVWRSHALSRMIDAKDTLVPAILHVASPDYIQRPAGFYVGAEIAIAIACLEEARRLLVLSGDIPERGEGS